MKIMVQIYYHSMMQTARLLDIASQKRRHYALAHSFNKRRLKIPSTTRSANSAFHPFEVQKLVSCKRMGATSLG